MEHAVAANAPPHTDDELKNFLQNYSWLSILDFTDAKMDSMFSSIEYNMFIQEPETRSWPKTILLSTIWSRLEWSRRPENNRELKNYREYNKRKKKDPPRRDDDMKEDKKDYQEARPTPKISSKTI